MTTYLDTADAVAILKHYGIDVGEGHLRKGTSIVMTGGMTAEGEVSIGAVLGDHRAHRLVPVTDFLAWGLVGELAEPLLKPETKLGKAIANLIVKLSRMFVESHLAYFTLTGAARGRPLRSAAKNARVRAHP